MNTSINTSLSTSLPCYYGWEVIGSVPCGGPGIGVCNTTTGSCVCADGYSGWSDFVSMDETQYGAGGRVLDCHMHALALQVLYSLPMLVNLYAMVLALFALDSQIAMFRKLQARRRRRSRLRRQNTSMRLTATVRHWWDHAPLVIVVVYIAIAGPVGIALAIWKIAQPEIQFGIHGPYTFLTGVWLISCVHIGLFERLHALDTTAKSRMTGDAKEAIAAQAASLRFTVKWAYVPSYIVYTPILAAPFLEYIPTWGSGQKGFAAFGTQRVIYIAYHFCIAFNMAVLFGTSLMASRRMRAMFVVILGFPHDDDKKKSIEDVRNRFLEAETVQMKGPVVLGVWFLLCIAVPPLWTRNGYAFPLMHLLLAVGFVKIMNTMKAKRGVVADARSATQRIYTGVKKRAKSMGRRISTVNNTASEAASTHVSVVPTAGPGGQAGFMHGGAAMNIGHAATGGQMDFKSTSRAGTAKATSGRPMMMVIQPPGGHVAPL